MLFIISLTLFIQIFVYYILEVPLITFIATLFVSFIFNFNKFFYTLAFSPKKKRKKKRIILQSKKNEFLL